MKSRSGQLDPFTLGVGVVAMLILLFVLGAGFVYVLALYLWKIVGIALVAIGLVLLLKFRGVKAIQNLGIGLIIVGTAFAIAPYVGDIFSAW